MTDYSDQDIQADIASLGHKADVDYLAIIKNQTAIERDWWQHVEPFNDADAVDDAVVKGKLLYVGPHEAYLPILRFRNPTLRHSYPPFLETHTLNLLNEIANSWRRQSFDAGVNSDSRLAVTNLVTTVAYQKTLVQTGKLAIMGNPHSRGVAFDIDATGYYLGETPVNHRPADKDKYEKAFANTGHILHAPEFLSDDKYFNPLVHEILQSTLDRFQEQGKLHYIHEYPGTNYSAFHICRNPNYSPVGM
ncbi:hypothetical protein IT415_02235 [bacterium]|nr:hypothetical protein [bacterium]